MSAEEALADVAGKCFVGTGTHPKVAELSLDTFCCFMRCIGHSIGCITSDRFPRYASDCGRGGVEIPGPAGPIFVSPNAKLPKDEARLGEITIRMAT